MRDTGLNRTYNYKHFTPEEYDFSVFHGLNVGESFFDADVYTFDGVARKLSDYVGGKPLVLEIGSMTCPMYARSAREMKPMPSQYPGLNFAILYVREAHPGERVGQHETIEDKIAAAKMSCTKHAEERLTLVDNIDGTGHQAYGSKPNSIYVIGTDGTILFRSIWNNAPQIVDVLQALSEEQKLIKRELDARPPFSLLSVRTLMMGGWVAFFDFVTGLPRLIMSHRKAGNM
jgi:Iodothyronine deiodinase